MKLFYSCLVLVFLVALTPSFAQEKSPAPAEGQQSTSNTYKENEALEAAEDFLGKGAKGLAMVIAKAFKDLGEPVAFIRGEEGGGAIGVGLRYGRGELVRKGAKGRKVYWQGPSVGFDIGGNVAKVFVLVYNLSNNEALFQRFPGVEGSAYFVGGVGLNYNQSGEVILAPVRLGIGWRLGVGVGYLHFTKKKSYWPF
jgi:hypothetical protein